MFEALIREERAARQFIDLCLSGAPKRLLFGVVDAVTASEIDAAVDMFMKACGRPAPGLKQPFARLAFAPSRRYRSALDPRSCLAPIV